MKYILLIICVVLQNFQFSTCISVSKLTKARGNGVNFDKSAGTELELKNGVTGMILGTKKENGPIKSTDKFHGYFNIHPLTKRDIQYGGVTSKYSKQVHKDKGNRDMNVSSSRDKSRNKTDRKPLSELISILDGILTFHSENDEIISDNSATQDNGVLLQTEESEISTMSPNTISSGILDDVLELLTIKISKDSFSKLFFPNDSNTESSFFSKQTSAANSNFIEQKSFLQSVVDGEKTFTAKDIRKKNQDERLSRMEDNTITKLKKNEQNIKRKNITVILNDMNKLVAQDSEEFDQLRLPASARPPLAMDEVLQQMQLLIDSPSEITSKSRSRYTKKFESTKKHMDMPEILTEMDKILLPKGVNPPLKSSSRPNMQIILNRMQSLIEEHKKPSPKAETSKLVLCRRRRSLRKQVLKDYLPRSGLSLSSKKFDAYPSNKEPNEETCTPPYIDVAYKVCILPVLDQQLSWHDARQYCRSRSLDLAMDSAVNKGRKYFNNRLGLTGTRESWTLWVGARRSEEEDRWLWNDGFKVPNFIWSKNQPRVYGPDSRPVGTCMAIHGFSEYYAAALPCHHKRRFVCQKL